jgi:hypothetical protein
VRRGSPLRRRTTVSPSTRMTGSVWRSVSLRPAA